MARNGNGMQQSLVRGRLNYRLVLDGIDRIPAPA
jgi:hypothetical protein